VQVTVEPQALAEWSAHARRTGTVLQTRLAALDDGLAPLAGTWRGAAADGFAARHAQWRDASVGILGTLAELTALVDTAFANYVAATEANQQIWQAGTPSTTLVVPAMSAGGGRGTGRGRITADLEDIRATVAALAVTADELAAAWTGLGVGLAETAAMAGDDDAGAAFAADYEAMAAAAWQGWRRTAVMLDGLAGGLAATGNNLAAAEKDSTPGPRRPFARIVAHTGSPALPPPPSAVGAVGGRHGPYWPTADPARLRRAAAAWSASAVGLRSVVGRVFAAVDGLVQANPDRVLQEMRRFTRAGLSDDPTSGLSGVLAVTGGRVASACTGLADLTERTRSRILATAAHYAAGEEWYHAVADALGLVVKGRPGRAVAAAGDEYLMNLELSTIHQEHVRAVESLRGELHPAGADRLARIATAMAPPTPVPANTCMLTSPTGATGAPVPEAHRQALIAEVVAAGHKISPAEVVQIARAPDERVVWLERGDDESGLAHILQPGRIANFADRGVALADIPGVAMRAVTEGRRLGSVRDGGVAYELNLPGGRSTNVVVVVGSNGYVVTARPLGNEEGVSG
jgi:WXG100 family type VII secretion target